MRATIEYTHEDGSVAGLDVNFEEDWGLTPEDIFGKAEPTKSALVAFVATQAADFEDLDDPATVVVGVRIVDWSL